MKAHRAVVPQFGHRGRAAVVLGREPPAFDDDLRGEQALARRSEGRIGKRVLASLAGVDDDAMRRERRGESIRELVSAATRARTTAAV